MSHKKKKPFHYTKYFMLDKLLSAQNFNQSKVHDEMLFIITHQSFELWFKQIIFELRSIVLLFKTDSVLGLKRIQDGLDRVSKIQKCLVQNFEILETMSPSEFAKFRDALSPASGLQSFQFRLLESIMGYRYSESQLNFFKGHFPLSQFKKILHPEQSLQSAFEAFLNKESTLNLAWIHFHKIKKHEKKAFIFRLKFMNENKYFSNHAKELIAMIQSSSDPLCQKSGRVLKGMVQMDLNHLAWKKRHMEIVHRMIGVAMGTGGTTGAAYLSSQAKVGTPFGNLIIKPKPRK